MRKLYLKVLLLSLLGVTSALASSFDDIGYTRLQTELGSSVPNGAGVKVAQVEAKVDTDPTAVVAYSWIANPQDSQLISKTLTEISVGSVGFSAHATAVAQVFFGSTLSTAPGITAVDLFEAFDWLTTGFLRAGEGIAPNISATHLANHSWVTDATTGNTEILRRVDFVVEQDEFIQAVAMSFDPVNKHLLSDSFNAIVVSTSKGDWVGTTAIDTVYTGGRARPDIVAPESTLSGATPRVASAAALLIDYGKSAPSLSTDPSAVSTTNRNGDVIYNAERSETIKAVLMAGADRNTVGNTSPASAPVDITDYRSVGNQTTNGLDTRFGAGQVNIYNSYHILNAGEQNSAEDQPANSGAIANQGFDYDPAFGGQGGSNATATYNFSTNGNPGQKLKADLVWNLNATPNPAVLYDMDLQLIDVTGGNVTVVSSTSTIDNTENIWFDLVSNNSYQLQVVRGGGAPFNWDYALAWQITSAPVVAAGQSFFIDENSPVSTPVNTVSATVITGAVTGYSIVSGNTGNAFAIDNSGVLTVAGAIDYESIISYSLGITATDGLNVSAPEIVVVDVNNLNDVAPVVASSQTLSIDENSVNGTSVGTVSASDVDSVITGFAIVGSSTKFAIDNNGLIAVIGAIDYENTASYTLSITATDGVNLSSAVDVVINVNNLDDTPPTVTPAQSFTIDENSAATTVVGTVIATDAADAGGIVSGFNIVSGNTNNTFAIANNGVITVSGAIDYETTTSYTLGVTATDNSANTSSASNVVITVNDLNDVAPVIASSQTLSVDENSVNGTSVGTVSANDVDSSITGFTIIGGSTVFSIDSKGLLTVIGAIDFETTPSYTLNISATDGVNISSPVAVVVNVNNLNDVAPVIDPSQTFTIDENSSNGISPGTVAASDIDSAITDFTIVGGSAVFSIANNGLITVTGAIDFETTASYTLGVTATDGVTTSATVNIVINVNNLDEIPPVVTSAQSFNVDENSVNATVVGTVLATDSVADTGGVVTGFNIVSGNTNNAFAIDNNGVITVSGAIDYETTASYTLGITATDGVNTSAVVTVVVAVNDIAESSGGGSGGGGGSIHLMWLLMPLLITVSRRKILQ